MRNDGGWLSPEGHLLWCTQSHVMAMINFPQALARGTLMKEGEALPAAATELSWTDLDARGTDAPRP